MLLNNKRQRLILNRIKRHQTPPKNMELGFGLRLLNVQLQTKPKNANRIQMQNSSNFLMEKENLIKCRSISSFLHRSKTPLRLHTQNRVSMAAGGMINLNKQIQLICQQTVQEFARKINNKWKDHQLGEQNLVSLLLQLALKLIDRIQNKNIKVTGDKIYKQQKLKICKAVQLSKVEVKQTKLSFNSTIQLHIPFKESESTLLDLQNGRQELILIANQHRYLKAQISQLQKKIKTLLTQIQSLNQIIKSKIEQAKKIEDQAKKSQDYANNVQQRLIGITAFAGLQNNKTLQIKTQQYKDSQQQLFDYAFLFDQTPPIEPFTHILSVLLTPYQHFQISLKLSTQQELQQNQSYIVTPEDLRVLKIDINNAYQSTINNLKELIQGKFCKTQKFVEIIKKLSQKIIIKRQYLTQINKKMAVTSVKIDGVFNNCDSLLQNANVTQQLINGFTNLKQLFTQIRDIYCQAEIFY